MGFEQKPLSAAQRAKKDTGEMRQVLIEKHDKDADARKMLGIYQKNFDAEVVERTEDGIVIRYSAEKADAYHKACQDEAQRRVKRVQTVSPDPQYQEMTKVTLNRTEDISPRELIGG